MYAQWVLHGYRVDKEAHSGLFKTLHIRREMT